MNLAELEWRTRQLVGTAHTDDGVEAPADAQDAVNDVYLEVADEEPWPWLVDRWTVLVDGGRADLPADVAKVLHVSLGDDRLEVVPPVAIAGDEDATGTPDRYALDGRELVLHPVPADTAELELRGVKLAEPLGYTDEPLFHRTFHPILSFRAAAELLDRAPEEDPRVDRYRRRAHALLERMRAHYRASYDQQPIVVGGRRSESRR